jgi:acyl carrier protein
MRCGNSLGKDPFAQSNEISGTCHAKFTLVIHAQRNAVMPTATDLSPATRVLPTDRVVGIVHEILERRDISRRILADDDLREAGLNSLDMVNLMLAVEAEFDLKIPDADMTLRNFRCISAIEALVASLRRA